MQVRFNAGGAHLDGQRLLAGGKPVRLERLESVLVNDGGHGFYRVRYSGELLERLLAGSTGSAASSASASSTTRGR